MVYYTRDCTQGACRTQDACRTPDLESVAPKYPYKDTVEESSISWGIASLKGRVELPRW